MEYLDRKSYVFNDFINAANILSFSLSHLIGNISCKDRHNKEQKWQGYKQKQKRLRRGGKNTQKNYTKKDHTEPDNHDGVITHLEPDILEC